MNAKVVYNRTSFTWVVYLHGFGGSWATWQKQISDYSSRYNLLLLDMHSQTDNNPLTVNGLCAEIAETMKNHNVDIAHIVSLSSGSLVALAFAALYPQKVVSMALAGGMLSFNPFTNLLLTLARLLQNILPYMFLYRFFSYIIMPNANHQKSRDIFIREAEKLGHYEFCRWINFIPLLKKNKVFIESLNNLPRRLHLLYIMGSEDHLFTPSILKVSSQLLQSSFNIIPHCGHVCSIEKPSDFNRISLTFFAQEDSLFQSQINTSSLFI